MEQPLSADDVLAPQPTVGAMLRRGLHKRCARCGGRGLFTSWYRMRARCPECGYKFERESGFFVGAWFVSFMLTEALVFVLVVGFVFEKNANNDASALPVVLAAILVSIVVPLVFYPFSRTIWAAIDLAMSPLELEEIVDAQDAADAADAPPDR